MIERKQITAASLDPNGLSKMRDVLQIVPYSRTTISKMIKEGAFPRQVRLNARLHVWRNADLLAYLENIKQANQKGLSI